MSYIGSNLSLTLVLVATLATASVAGATVYYQESADRVTDRNERLQERNAELRSELQATRANLSETEQRLQRLNRSLETRQGDLQAVTQKLNATESRLASTENKLSNARERLQSARSEVQSLESQVQQLRSDVSSLQDRVDELKSQRETLKEQKATLEQKNEDLAETNDDLEATNEELEQTNEELQATNAQLEQKNEELQATNEELRAKIDDLEAEIERLNDRIDELESDDGGRDRGRRPTATRSGGRRVGRDRRANVDQGGSRRDSTRAAEGGAARRRRRRGAHVTGREPRAVGPPRSGPPPTVGPLPLAAAAGVACGLVVTVASVGVRHRRDAIARFERFNPTVETALRSARDASEDERTSLMARRLYDDVLERLRETSSQGFLNGRTLALRMGLVLVVSLASVHVAVVGMEFGVGTPSSDGGGDGARAVTTASGTSVDRETLDDPSAVLGEAENVTSGSEELAANLSTGGGGRNGEDGTGDAYDAGGLSSGDDVSAQRAGFDSPGELEDADLIRDYTVRLSEEDSDE
ncbi:hypothetical protein VB773_06980 [Haloarculaceae archaeon H-GB2-1]|nr:hypothetical protein [Haloarculaceae archaeon H-GB2-1]